jgi:hypothetical protein
VIERHAVVGVLGCSGGIGSSTFAAVLACVAGAAMLVDLDASGGGIDVLLGVEDASGARWSGVRVGGGRLDPALLTSSVPRWGPCGVLAADVRAIPADALVEVVDAAQRAGPVVLDLPRGESAARDAGLSRCDLVVLVVRADIVGIAAAHAVAQSVPDVPCGVVARKGPVPCAEAARLLELPLLGVLPGLRAAPSPPTALWSAASPTSRRRLPRATARVAAGVVDGLQVRRSAA